MLTINGIPAAECEPIQLLRALERVTKQRDDYRNANQVVNEKLGEQFAQIQLLETELKILKQEIAKIPQ